MAETEERLAGTGPSLMGEFKASRMSVYVTLTRTGQSLPVALGSGTKPNTLPDAGVARMCAHDTVY